LDIPLDDNSKGNVGPFSIVEYELVEDILEALSFESNVNSLYVNVIVQKLGKILKFHATALGMSNNSTNKIFSLNDTDFSGFVHELIDASPHDFELRLPTRTIFGKTLIDLQISFWGFLSFAVEKTFDSTEIGVSFINKVEKFMGEKVFNKMTADLLVSIATNPEVSKKTKQKAIVHLAKLWEENTIQAMHNFAPHMESIWNARKQAKIVMGTMMGIQEMFDMQIHGATHYFLDFFAEHADNEQVRGAFREFLFGATYEELVGKDRERKKKGVVSRDNSLNSDALPKGNLDSSREQALGIYRFFTKRKLEASARMIAGSPGPKHTAEEFLLIYFIENNL